MTFRDVTFTALKCARSMKGLENDRRKYRFGTEGSLTEIRFEGTTGGEYAKPAHFPSLMEEALENHRFLSP